MTGVDDFDWDELLLYVRDRRVVPIVGRDLLVVAGEHGAPVPLHQLLARRLAGVLGLEREEIPPDAGVDDVAFRFLRRGGDRRRIYSGLRRVVEETPPAIPSSLEKLAAIADFRLFVSTTFDGLLVRALDQVRFRGDSRSRAIVFSP